MTLQRTKFDHLQESIDAQSLGIDLLLSTRRSYGSFTPEAPSWEEIVALLQAGRCAPSFFNSQPWGFVVITDEPGRETVDANLIDWGADWAIEAPVLIAIVANTPDGTVHEGINYAYFDCGAAVENILLQATSMGLAAHPVVSNHYAAVENALNIPPDQTLLLFVAIGYPGPGPSDTNARRMRKPLIAMTARGKWNGPPIEG